MLLMLEPIYLFYFDFKINHPAFILLALATPHRFPLQVYELRLDQYTQTGRLPIKVPNKGRAFHQHCNLKCTIDNICYSSLNY